MNVAGPEAPRLGQVRQAEAWFAQARPADYRRWDHALLNADLDGDDAGCVRLQQDLVTQWREHRDDPLPDDLRDRAELAQGIAWLGIGLGLGWRSAHALATPDEQASDQAHLLDVWRQHREMGIPHAVREDIGSLIQTRRGRLFEAEAWYRDRDPHGYAEWVTRRGFADTTADEWADNRLLIQEWIAETGGTTSPSTAPSPAQKRVREIGQRTVKSRVQGWLHPWRQAPEPEEHAPGRGL